MEAKELLDSLDAGVAAVAPDWTVAAWSAAAARITGLAPERVLGRSFWSAFPAAKGTALERVMAQVFDDGNPQTYLAPTGAPDAGGGVEGVGGAVFEMRITHAPGDELVVSFRPVREDLAPETRAAQLLSALETERRLYV